MQLYSPEFIEKLKRTIKLSAIVGSYVTLQKRGNEWVGLSPFSNEKTPSFFVNDEKGFYHCFSSGEHGDAISFVRFKENLSFAEAIERLGASCGMKPRSNEVTLLAESPQKKRYFALYAAAEAFYRQHLRTAAAAAIRNYLESRGIGAQLIEDFRLGAGPKEGHLLGEAMQKQGFSLEFCCEKGLLTARRPGEIPRDRFAARLVFPLHDTAGRCVGFAGRSLAKNARAKYLNSPTTEFFHKKTLLYNFHRARKHASSDKPLLFVEGYTDVIALEKAGWCGAVAAMGTQIGAQQLDLAWSASPRPVCCFDGDSAGRRAAFRLCELALPLLRSDAGLRFAFLPAGLDPDDIITRQGHDAFAKILEGSKPVYEILWLEQILRYSAADPDDKAQIRANLRERLSRIADRDLRAAYGDFFAQRFVSPFFTGGGVSFKARQGTGEAASIREESIIHVIVNHPWLITKHEAEIASLPLADPALRDLLRGLVTKALCTQDGLAREEAKHYIKCSAWARRYATIANAPHLRILHRLSGEAAAEEAEEEFLNLCQIQRYRLGLRDEAQRLAETAGRDAQSEERWRHGLREKLAAEKALLKHDPGRDGK